jgi:hypothetical protein
VIDQTGKLLPQVGFLLFVLSGVWLAGAELPFFRFATERTIVACKALALGGVLLIVATRWTNVGQAALASLARIEGRDAEASELLQRCLAILRNTGDRKRIAEVPAHLAWVSLDRNQADGARELLIESRRLFEAASHPRGLVLCNLGMTLAALGLGAGATAREEAEAGLALAQQTGLRHEEGAALALLAQAAWLEDEDRQAAAHARERSRS